MRILNAKTVVQFLSLEKEEKAGFLWKRRSENKGSFKRRYFTACGNILAYFEKKLDRDPLGIIILEGHVVEMLDDLTMALRFPSIGDACRSYVLRGESIEDTEQWMRVLSRSGTDFFTLTLEDLEDQLSALTAVRRSSNLEIAPLSVYSSSNQTNSGPGTTPPGRANPFNRSSAPPPPAGSQTVMSIPPPGTFKSNVASSTPSKPISSENHPRSYSPGRHLKWLLTQNWEQLHSRVRKQITMTTSNACVTTRTTVT